MYIVGHYSKCFQNVADEQPSANYDAGTKTARPQWPFHLVRRRRRRYCSPGAPPPPQPMRQAPPPVMIEARRMKEARAKLTWYPIATAPWHAWCYRCVQPLGEDRSVVCLPPSGLRRQKSFKREIDSKGSVGIDKLLKSTLKSKSNSSDRKLTRQKEQEERATQIDSGSQYLDEQATARIRLRTSFMNMAGVKEIRTYRRDLLVAKIAI